jgi:hypothetical protein
MLKIPNDSSACSALLALCDAEFAVRKRAEHLANTPRVMLK